MLELPACEIHMLAVTTSEIRKLVVVTSKKSLVITNETTQPAIACSKLTIETLEQGVKYVQS